MINVEIIDIATRRIGVDFVAHDERIAKAVWAVKSKFAVAGLAASSMTVLQLEAVYIAAIKERITIVWGAIKWCLEAEATNYFAGIADELKRWVHSFAPIQSSAFGWSTDEEAVRLSLQNMELYSRDSLRKAHMEAHAQVDVEIDQFVLLLKRTSRMPQNPTHTFNITGSTIANLQTGAGAAATVNQTVAGAEQQWLVASLNELKSELMACKNMQPQTLADTVELVEDCVKETQKAAPNKIKLGALVQGIGATIDGAVGFAGKLPAAVTAVKSAAAALGIC